MNYEESVEIIKRYAARNELPEELANALNVVLEVMEFQTSEAYRLGFSDAKLVQEGIRRFKQDFDIIEQPKKEDAEDFIDKVLAGNLMKEFRSEDGDTIEFKMDQYIKRME